MEACWRTRAEGVAGGARFPSREMTQRADYTRIKCRRSRPHEIQREICLPPTYGGLSIKKKASEHENELHSAKEKSTVHGFVSRLKEEPITRAVIPLNGLIKVDSDAE